MFYNGWHFIWFILGGSEQSNLCLEERYLEEIQNLESSWFFIHQEVKSISEQREFVKAN